MSLGKDGMWLELSSGLFMLLKDFSNSGGWAGILAINEGLRKGYQLESGAGRVTGEQR